MTQADQETCRIAVVIVCFFELSLLADFSLPAAAHLACFMTPYLEPETTLVHALELCLVLHNCMNRLLLLPPNAGCSNPAGNKLAAAATAVLTSSSIAVELEQDDAYWQSQQGPWTHGRYCLGDHRLDTNRGRSYSKKLSKPCRPGVLVPPAAAEGFKPSETAPSFLRSEPRS